MSSLSQNNRLVTINTPLGNDVFIVQRLRGSEILSSLYEFTITMQSDKLEITPAQIMGQPVTLTLNGGSTETPRFFHGHISLFTAHDIVDGNKRTYKATIVPALWFTKLGGQNRIFENMSFSDIITDVLKDYSAVRMKNNTTGTYLKRRYCVQYEESDFEFISRVLAEEGVSYYFEHSDGQHTFCLVDKAGSYPTALAQAITYSEGGSNPLENSIYSWVRNYGYHTSEVAFRDYLPFSASEWFKKTTTEKTTNNALKGERPLKEYYGRFHYEKQEDHTDKLTESNFKQKVKNTLLAHEGSSDVASGSSACPELFAGGVFEIDHTIESESGKYLVRTISHTVVDGNDQKSGYSNSFTCVPDSVYTPPDSDAFRRVVSSPDVAKVLDVKASAEQGSTDKYTQIKVQFPWKSDQNSGWLRVVQPYAGNNWGASFVPRVGQEVVVEYLSGDPDRPIVTGALYNSDNIGPGYSKTQSGFKSQFEGSKFNELRLDDKKGSEEIYFEAGKDWNVVVHNDNVETVERHQNVTVTENRSVTVKNGNETKDVGGTQTTTVKSDITIESKSKITLKVGSSSITLDPNGITLKGTNINSKSSANTKTEAGAMMDIKAGAMMNVKGALVKIN
ncbi:type VI secretion system Vgr family protein [Endozoicomonas arenosclerae]|uniref:type VI secretion system Vgr family protein n=1 Tax=Endozoicomonas arenosclerae TaxID=1633495 RepID=UPI00078669FC|nr:type VI secretion system tip protein TssI/VgrG [Endozoicomonas arenosclerae]